MGGQSDLSLSSHQTDDQQYYAKREELQKILPSLEQHLNTLSIITIPILKISGLATFFD